MFRLKISNIIVFMLVLMPMMMTINPVVKLSNVLNIDDYKGYVLYMSSLSFILCLLWSPILHRSSEVTHSFSIWKKDHMYLLLLTNNTILRNKMIKLSLFLIKNIAISWKIVKVCSHGFESCKAVFAKWGNE